MYQGKEPKEIKFKKKKKKFARISQNIFQKFISHVHLMGYKIEAGTGYCVTII